MTILFEIQSESWLEAFLSWFSPPVFELVTTVLLMKEMKFHWVTNYMVCQCGASQLLFNTQALLSHSQSFTSSQTVIRTCFFKNPTNTHAQYREREL